MPWGPTRALKSVAGTHAVWAIHTCIDVSKTGQLAEKLGAHGVGLE